VKTGSRFNLDIVVEPVFLKVWKFEPLDYFKLRTSKHLTLIRQDPQNRGRAGGYGRNAVRGSKLNQLSSTPNRENDLNTSKVNQREICGLGWYSHSP
jgi:hypothetical protein